MNRKDRSASPPSRTGKGKKRQLRACDYCRTHRIKCVPVDGEERCKRCVDHDMSCDRSTAAPKDSRPRRRLLFKNGSGMSQFQGVEAGYLGSSSLSLLAWKYAPQRPDIIDKFRNIDDRHDLHRGTIGGLEQDGLLVGQSGPDSTLIEKPTLISVSLARSKLIQELGAESVLTALYETCRDRLIPVFPVISVSESLLADKATEDHVNKYAAVDPHSTPPTPLPHIVRMIHCAIAAASRDVPQNIRENIHSTLRNLLMGPEMAKLVNTRCIGTIQVLTLLSMCDELNNVDAAEATEIAWQNVGTAIRMGFGIGLHRNISPSQIPYFQLNRRFRVWGACIAMDRWHALRLGRPFTIDLADCDAPLPRNYADGIRDGDLVGIKEPTYPCFRFLADFTTLSIFLGRAYKLVGTPSGLQSADGLSFMVLQTDIDMWLSKLPTSWPYSINIVLRQAPALINLFIVALEFTFQRALLWPTTPIPNHITYRPAKERWQNLCQRAEQAVYWLSTPDGAFYLDVWSMVAYPAFICVIILFKALEELNDPHHRWLLEMADNVIQQWAAQSSANSLRMRLSSMSSLLRAASPNVGAITSGSMPLSIDTFLANTAPVPNEADAAAFDQMILDMGLDPMWLENL